MHRLLLVAASKSATRTTTALPIIKRAAVVPSSSSPSSSTAALRSLGYARASRRCLSSETPAAATATASTANDAVEGATEDADEIKVGAVKHFEFRKAFGFIIPDGVDPKDHRDDELIFLHMKEIKRVDNGSKEKIHPQVNIGQRIQFKVEPPLHGKNMWRAREITLEGGDLVPPFHEGYLEKMIKSKKAKFGEEVFDIFRTAMDQTELETRIVEAYDRTKNDIERQRGRVIRASELAGHTYVEVEEK